MARKTRAASAERRRPEHCGPPNTVQVLGMHYQAGECANELTGMDVTALVIAIIGAATGVAGVVTAVISIRIARRTATAGDVTAIATKTATEVAQQQLAIERDRHHHELEQRHEDDAPALAGHIVKNDGDDGDGHARLEIHVTNSVRLTTVTIILPASAPVSLHGRSPMMEQWAQFPETGSGQIEVGRPARWNVDLAGRPQPFDVLVIAHADYGMKWDRLPVRVAFDD
jgi:hypothetical protein